MSAADTFLDSGFSALLSVAGESLVFPDGNTVSGIVDRSYEHQINGVPLATSIEVQVSAVITTPIVAQVIEDSIPRKHTVHRIRRVNSNLVILCFTFSDLPTESVLLGPTTYQCYVLDSTEGTDMQLGGLSTEDLHRVAIARHSFPLPNALPVEGQRVTFRGTDYGCVKVDRGDGGMPVILDLAATTSKNQS